MEKIARQKLRLFLQEYIPFKELKEVGFFDKSIRKTDYEKIAERICIYFGYKNIYEYAKDPFEKKEEFKNFTIDKSQMFTDKWLN